MSSEEQNQNKTDQNWSLKIAPESPYAAQISILVIVI